MKETTIKTEQQHPPLPLLFIFSSISPPRTPPQHLPFSQKSKRTKGQKEEASRSSLFSTSFVSSICFSCSESSLRSMDRIALLIVVMSLVLSPHVLPGAQSTTFTLVNKCDHTVWPGILSNAGTPPFPTGGFTLTSGSSKSLTAPSAWGGRFWARTFCTTSSSNSFSCLTGDCSSGTIDCSGKTASPPATLAEFTLDGSGGLDFFDVSLVDGYNLPVLVTPKGGSGQNCTSTGCVVDLNGLCPSDLRVTSSESEGGVVACKSACEAYGRPEYCCSGEYSSPATCKPSSYSEVFKSACPKAYSYAYDDRTSTFTCTSGADYVITFCPSPNTSQKSSSSDQQMPGSSSSTGSDDNSPLFNNSTMIYTGVQDTSKAPLTFHGTSLGWIGLTGVVSLLQQLERTSSSNLFSFS